MSELEHEHALGQSHAILCAAISEAKLALAIGSY